MVFGRNDEILHPRSRGRLGPELRVVEIGIKMFKIPVVDVVGNLFVMLDPFMPGGKGIQPPMNKHSKSVLNKPLGISGGGHRF
jgi:hypothetical protein